MKSEPSSLAHPRSAICAETGEHYRVCKPITHAVKRHLVHSFGLVVAALMSLPYVFAQPANLGKLEVRVESFRNTKGALGCQIFLGEKGFPEDAQAAKAGMFVPISGASAVCIFEGLAQGAYAVTVLHDENNSKVMDRNILGAPKEGYGVSNNKTYALSPPKWEESKFELGVGEQKQINIKLRY
jgi:uncharacterized protein (DUF2141 family)